MPVGRVRRGLVERVLGSIPAGVQREVVDEVLGHRVHGLGVVDVYLTVEHGQIDEQRAAEEPAVRWSLPGRTWGPARIGDPCAHGPFDRHKAVSSGRFSRQGADPRRASRPGSRTRTTPPAATGTKLSTGAVDPVRIRMHGQCQRGLETSCTGTP
jgi:hypothetical protein